MGNLKQRLIKAGRDYNYAEGVKVKASAAVYADQIVVVSGSEGVFIKVQPADAGNDESLKSIGRLMIAKHDIPVDGYGVVLPWKLVTTLATTAGAIGDPIYLADSVSAAVAGNLTLTCPASAKAIVVGRIAIVGAAGTGAILVHADAPEERVQGGAITGVAGAPALKGGRPTEQLVIETAASATAQDFTLDYPIIITGMAVVAKAGSAGVNINLYKGATTTQIALVVATGATINIKTSTTGIIPANCIIPAETAIRVKKSGAGTAGDLVIIDYIRG